MCHRAVPQLSPHLFSSSVRSSLDMVLGQDWRWLLPAGHIALVCSPPIFSLLFFYSQAWNSSLVKTGGDCFLLGALGTSPMYSQPEWLYIVTSTSCIVRDSNGIPAQAGRCKQMLCTPLPRCSFCCITPKLGNAWSKSLYALARAC